MRTTITLALIAVAFSLIASCVEEIALTPAGRELMTHATHNPWPESATTATVPTPAVTPATVPANGRSRTQWVVRIDVRPAFPSYYQWTGHSSAVHQHFAATVLDQRIDQFAGGVRARLVGRRV